MGIGCILLVIGRRLWGNGRYKYLCTYALGEKTWIIGSRGIYRSFVVNEICTDVAAFVQRLAKFLYTYSGRVIRFQNSL